MRETGCPANYFVQKATSEFYRNLGYSLENCLLKISN